jgi:hypothetical protein
MRTFIHICIASLLAILALAAPAVANDDVFAKCSVKDKSGKSVIPKERWQALADNLTDGDFAKFDKECKGKANNREAVALASRARNNARDRVVQDLRTDAQVGADPGVLSTDFARRTYGPAPKLKIPFLFRDAYSTYSLLSPPAPRDRATGTQISYTRDYQNSNDIISGKGAVIGWNVMAISTDSDDPPKNFGVTRTLLAPGVEFDQGRNNKNPKLNTDYLAFKAIGEIEREVPGSLFPLQYLRYSGYLKTDSQGASKIAGGYAEWEPYSLDLAIGVAPRLFNSPLQFRWAPILHFEAEKVIDAGLLTNVTRGDVYARGGPIARADIFFSEGILRNLVLSAQYRYFWNTTSLGHSKDVRYFQADAAYNLDDEGIFALSATYRDGISPGNGARVQDIKTGLTVKY